MAWNSNYALERLERVSKGISRQGLYAFLDREFAAIEAGTTVLTVGAGGPVNGRLREHARRRGYAVVSLDIDEGRGPDVVGDLCTYDFGDRRFDAVVMSEVLEHVHTPPDALRNVRGAMREGGRLILTTPFLFPIHNRPRDYYRFTRYGLEFLLNDFRDVDVRERNSWAEAVNVLLVRHYKETDRPSQLLSPLLISLAYAAQPLAALLGRLAPNDFMTTGYNVTARK